MNRLSHLLYIITLFSLIGCYQEGIEELYPQENDNIEFAVPTIKVTKEDGTRAITTESLKKTALTNGDKFAVWGYCVPNMVGSSSTLDYNGATSTWLAKRALSLPNVFYTSGTDFLNTVTIGEQQTGSKQRKWYSLGKGLDGGTNGSVGANADDYQYTFFAYYPADDTGFRINPPNGSGNNQYIAQNSLIVQYTMPYNDGATVDLNDADSYNTNDAMLAMVENHKRGDGKVSFTFSHLLCGLTFQCNNFTEYLDYESLTNGEPTETGSDLLITKIKLGGTFHKTLRTNLFESSSSNFSFQGTYKAVYTIYDNAEGTTIPYVDSTPDDNVDETSQVLGNPLLLLCGTKVGNDDQFLGPEPYAVYDNTQELGDQAGIILEVTYQYKGPDGDTSKDGLVTTKQISLLATDRTFTPHVGVNYTIQLNWVGNEFAVIVIPDGKGTWEDGEANDGNTNNDDVVFE